MHFRHRRGPTRESHGFARSKSEENVWYPGNAGLGRSGRCLAGHARILLNEEPHSFAARARSANKDGAPRRSRNEFDLFAGVAPRPEDKQSSRAEGPDEDLHSGEVRSRVCEKMPAT